MHFQYRDIANRRNRQTIEYVVVVTTTAAAAAAVTVTDNTASLTQPH